MTTPAKADPVDLTTTIQPAEGKPVIMLPTSFQQHVEQPPEATPFDELLKRTRPPFGVPIGISDPPIKWLHIEGELISGDPGDLVGEMLTVTVKAFPGWVRGVLKRAEWGFRQLPRQTHPVWFLAIQVSADSADEAEPRTQTPENPPKTQNGPQTGAAK